MFWIRMWCGTTFGQHKHLLRCWCRRRMSTWKKTLTQALIYNFDAKLWPAQQRHKATNDTSWLPCGAARESAVSELLQTRRPIYGTLLIEAPCHLRRLIHKTQTSDELPFSNVKDFLKLTCQIFTNSSVDMFWNGCCCAVSMHFMPKVLSVSLDLSIFHRL